MCEKGDGFRYLVAIIGANHKMCTLNAVKTKSASEVPDCLIEHWKVCGRFTELASDHGPEFCADIIKELEKAEGMTKVQGMAYTPEVQGRIERHIRTVKYRFYRDILRIERSEGQDAAAKR